MTYLGYICLYVCISIHLSVCLSVVGVCCLIFVIIIIFILFFIFGGKEIFYSTTHSTHFIYGYIASDWEGGGVERDVRFCHCDYFVYRKQTDRNIDIDLTPKNGRVSFIVCESHTFFESLCSSSMDFRNRSIQLNICLFIFIRFFFF